MMKQWGALCAALALAALLSACAAEPVAWETVNDPAVQTAAGVLPEPYEILIAVPDEAEPAAEQGVYLDPAGVYEIWTEVLPATSPEAAIAAISGFPAEQLEVLRMQFGDLPEYQFAWVNETEEGTIYSRALLVTDERYYYVVQFRARDRQATADTQQQVFASFGLYYDEGV